MKLRHFGWSLLVYSIAWGSHGSAFAQSEKVTLRAAPAPNQTVKMRMVQDVQLEMTMPGAPALPGLQGMKMGTKSTTLITQKVGAANASGMSESEVTIEEAGVETTLNGQPMPVPGTTDNLVGKKIVIVIDKDGKTVDVKGMADISAVPDLTQLVKSAGGNLPSTSIAVGETVTAPLDLALPIPIAGSGLKMTGEVRYKLVSIDKDPDGARIARFEMTSQGVMASDGAALSPVPGVQMKMNMTISGSGTMFHDLDKGVLKSSESRSTTTGTFAFDGAGQMPPMTIQGVVSQAINRMN